MNVGDAMMNRPIIARRETVLRQRQRSSTRDQRGHNCECLQRSHVRTPKTQRLHLTHITHTRNESGSHLIQIKPECEVRPEMITYERISLEIGNLRKKTAKN
jgi:hypothetical protein